MIFNLLVIFLICIILLFIFHLLTKSYINPYKLIALVGNKGCGKTTYLTKKAIIYKNLGFNVYANFDIPGCFYFDTRNFGKFVFPRNSVIIIDEIGLLYHSRNFKTFPQEIRTYLKLQRQYGNIVILASQSWDFDKSIRDLCDELRLLKNVARVFTVSRKVNKRLTVVTTRQEEGSESGGLVEDYKFSSIFELGSIDLTFIPHWKMFFDTNYMATSNSIMPSSINISWSDYYAKLSSFFGYISVRTQIFFKYFYSNTKKRFSFIKAKN